MKTFISENPAVEAGEYISALLNVHADEHILLLLSGGSAFSILDHIETHTLGKHITIGMVDERFTTQRDGNNFLLFSETDFFSKAQALGVKFFVSVPEENEKQYEFAERMRETLEDYFYGNPECYAVGIFGVGEDGHTAGIFPAPEEEFNRIYKTDDFYTHVTQNRHEYSQRTTVTPAFIEEVLDEVLLYAVGKNKCENILDYMYNRVFAQHEIPALIPASHPQSVLFTDCPSLTP